MPDPHPGAEPFTDEQVEAAKVAFSECTGNLSEAIRAALRAAASAGGEREAEPSDEQARVRAHFVRLFNRLDAAVSRHRAAKAWTDDADDALYAAHDRVLRDAATGPGSDRSPDHREEGR